MKRDEFIKKNIFGKVLDIGCENGDLHKLITNENVFGLDIKPKKYKENVAKGDAQITPFKNNSFDTIIAGEVIEHLKSPKEMIDECQRIMKKDGILILSTPNKKSWVNRIVGSYNHAGHISLFDINSIKTLIENYFKIERFFLLPYDAITSWGSRHKNLFWLRRLVHCFVPESLRENMIILARKK